MGPMIARSKGVRVRYCALPILNGRMQTVMRQREEHWSFGAGLNLAGNTNVSVNARFSTELKTAVETQSLQDR